MTFFGADVPTGVGDLESEYELLGELGRGGMAVVYRARERATGREVAIKVVRVGATSDAAEAHARFAREAQTVAQLQHPNIVATYGIRPLASGGLGIVMQLVPGRTLKEVVREGGPFSAGRAADVLRQVASALAYAHAKGVVHRDVKPENIFLDERAGTALLSDFGIARTLEQDAALTQTGIAIGTPTYMSPEQIDGRAVDGRGDIYSLGLVGWEMLSGRQPWEGESLYSVIYNQKHEELPHLGDLRHDVPDGLQYVVERALSKDREHRWQTADELVRQLVDGADPEAVRRWRQRRARRLRPELAAALDREAASTDTLRFERPRPAAEPLALDEFFAERDAAYDVARRRRRRRAVGAGAAALLLAVAGATALTLRERGRAPLSTRTAGGHRVGDGMVRGGPTAGAGTAVAPGGGMSGGSTSTAPAAAGAFDSASGAGDTQAAGGPPPGADSPTVATARGDVGSVALPLGAPVAPRTAPPATAAPPPVTSRPASPIASAPPARESVAVPSAVADSPAATTPAPLFLPLERAMLAAGGRHTCVLSPRGEGRCFGGNDRGQLGDGGSGGELEPARVTGAFQFISIAAGSSHSCAVTRDGGLYCWGANDHGQLGEATTTPRDAPVRVVSNASFRAVRLGTSHSCALTRTGEVLCWGSNARGQLGDGTTIDRLAPTPIAVEGRRFTALAVGWNHSCALDESGHAFCWGENGAGQLGDGTRLTHSTPAPVAGGVAFAAISAGGSHSCAVTARGDAYCWGRNSYGQLGTGRSGDQPVPARVSSPVSFTAISAGGVHTCALARDGDAYCWGRNTYGQLGDGTTNDSPLPTRVASSTPYVFINASGAHSCAATAGGESQCWGYNIDGQLGDGTRTHRSRPVRVGSAAGG